jgi:hypothetical protein
LPSFVDKILRGTPPGELPVELPTVIEMAAKPPHRWRDEARIARDDRDEGRPGLRLNSAAHHCARCQRSE